MQPNYSTALQFQSPIPQSTLTAHGMFIEITNESNVLQYPFTTFSNSPSEEDLPSKPKINATTAWTADSRQIEVACFFQAALNSSAAIYNKSIPSPQNKSVGRLTHNKAQTF